MHIIMIPKDIRTLSRDEPEHVREAIGERTAGMLAELGVRVEHIDGPLTIILGRNRCVALLP